MKRQRTIPSHNGDIGSDIQPNSHVHCMRPHGDVDTGFSKGRQFEMNKVTINLIAHHIFKVYCELHPGTSSASAYSDICAVLRASISQGLIAHAI